MVNAGGMGGVIDIGQIRFIISKLLFAKLSKLYLILLIKIHEKSTSCKQQLVKIRETG